MEPCRVFFLSMFYLFIYLWGFMKKCYSECINVWYSLRIVDYSFMPNIGCKMRSSNLFWFSQWSLIHIVLVLMWYELLQKLINLMLFPHKL